MPELLGIPVRLTDTLDEQFVVMQRGVLEAQERAWLNGHRLGPLRFKLEPPTRLSDDTWIIRISADVIPVERGDLT